MNYHITLSITNSINVMFTSDNLYTGDEETEISLSLLIYFTGYCSADETGKTDKDRYDERSQKHSHSLLLHCSLQAQWWGGWVSITLGRTHRKHR